MLWSCAVIDATYADPLSHAKSDLSCRIDAELRSPNCDLNLLESLVDQSDDIERFEDEVAQRIDTTIKGYYCIPKAQDRAGEIAGFHVIKKAGWTGYFAIDFYFCTIVFVLAHDTAAGAPSNLRKSLTDLMDSFRKASSP